MAPPYEVKASPGKGLGVFATRAITPGTVIVHDTKKLNLFRPKNDITDDQVYDAIKSLSKEDCLTFLQLHEGDLPYAKKTMRIYKANAFGNDKEVYILLKVSRFNHSCSPNAEIALFEGEDDADVVALKPIEKGKEILISYFGSFEEGPTPERRLVTKANYGFVCGCAVCEMKGSNAQVSDMRRRLISVLAHRLQGMETLPVTVDTAVAGLSLRVEGAAVIVRSEMPLAEPLTGKERVTAHFVMGRLMEAEGMVNATLAHTYAMAAAGLLGQLKALQPVVVLAPVQYMIKWMEMAFGVMNKVRGPGSQDLIEMGLTWKIMEASEPMRAFRRAGMKSNTFAVEVGGKGRALTEAECQKFLKSEGIDAHRAKIRMD